MRSGWESQELIHSSLCQRIHFPIGGAYQETPWPFVSTTWWYSSLINFRHSSTPSQDEQSLSSWKKHQNGIKIYQADFHQQLNLAAKAQILASAHQEVPMASHHPLQSLSQNFFDFMRPNQEKASWLQEILCVLSSTLHIFLFQIFQFHQPKVCWKKNTIYNELVKSRNLGNPLAFGVGKNR